MCVCGRPPQGQFWGWLNHPHDQWEWFGHSQGPKWGWLKLLPFGLVWGVVMGVVRPLSRAKMGVAETTPIWLSVAQLLPWVKIFFFFFFLCLSHGGGRTTSPLHFYFLLKKSLNVFLLKNCVARCLNFNGDTCH
jgi:hypothetical protein